MVRAPLPCPVGDARGPGEARGPSPAAASGPDLGGVTRPLRDGEASGPVGRMGAGGLRRPGGQDQEAVTRERRAAFRWVDAASQAQA